MITKNHTKQWKVINNNDDDVDGRSVWMAHIQAKLILIEISACAENKANLKTKTRIRLIWCMVVWILVALPENCNSAIVSLCICHLHTCIYYFFHFQFHLKCTQMLLTLQRWTRFGSSVKCCFNGAPLLLSDYFIHRQSDMHIKHFRFGWLRVCFSMASNKWFECCHSDCFQNR